MVGDYTSQAESPREFPARALPWFSNRDKFEADFTMTLTISAMSIFYGGHALVVAMTAHDFPEDEKRCLDAGMDAHIPKPSDMKNCIALIEGLLGKRDRED